MAVHCVALWMEEWDRRKAPLARGLLVDRYPASHFVLSGAWVRTDAASFFDSAMVGRFSRDGTFDAKVAAVALQRRSMGFRRPYRRPLPLLVVVAPRAGS